MKQFKPLIPAIIILLIIGGIFVAWNTLVANKKALVSDSQTPATTQTQDTAPSSQSSANTNKSNKSYTLADIAQHKNATSCWMVINGKVYDVTTFIPQHPGGEAILRGCGIDATALFNGERAHAGGFATSLLTQYEIGTLAQ